MTFNLRKGYPLFHSAFFFSAVAAPEKIHKMKIYVLIDKATRMMRIIIVTQEAKKFVFSFLLLCVLLFFACASSLISLPILFFAAVSIERVVNSVPKYNVCRQIASIRSFLLIKIAL